jgi:TonB family protein
MPRDLFGDVTRPSISIGNRKWYTVPVSLLSHATIVALIVMVPLLAAPMMPGVFDDTDFDYLIDVVPIPTDLKPIADPNVAPTVAPTGFTDPPEAINDIRLDPGVLIGDTIDNVLPPPPPVVVAKPVHQDPIRVGGTIRQPQKVRHVDPVYPQMAILARVEGVVIIEATIGADGRLMDARVLRGHHMLDPPALAAVRQWEFTPTLLNGVPVPVIMTVTVQFKLSK